MIIEDRPEEKSQQFWNHDNIYLYLPRLDALKHVLGGVEIVLRLFVRVVQPGFDVDGYYDRLQRWWWWWWRCRCSGVQCSLVFWVILEYRSTHNGGGKAALLWDQAETRWQLPFGGLASSLSDQFQHREKDHHLSPFSLKQVLCSLHVSVDVLRSWEYVQ